MTKNNSNSKNIAELRVQLTHLSRRLRQISQNDPQTWAAMLILSAIDRMGNGVTPSQLAEEEKMHSSNLATLLRQLEDRALIERRRDLKDKRKTRVSLSAQGAKVLAESRAIRDDWLSEAIENLLNIEEQELLLKVGHYIERISLFNSNDSNGKKSG